jgi:hypothetical protein
MHLYFIQQNDTILPGKIIKADHKNNMVGGPIEKTITIESNAVNYEEGKFP